MDLIAIEDFKKIELKVGTVTLAEEVVGSDKLIRLEINLGEEKPRQVLTGLKAWYTPADFMGKQVVIISNLQPRMMMGVESQGMLLAVDGSDGKPVLLQPTSEVEVGSVVR